MNETRTMVLPVALTEPEVLARAKELTGLIQEHREATVRLENLAAAFKSAKATAEEEIADVLSSFRNLSTVIRNGREDREVEVMDTPDYKAGVMLTHRLDTHELVASRGLTEAERQRSLFSDAAEAMRPKPGSGIDSVEITSGGKGIKLNADGSNEAVGQ